MAIDFTLDPERLVARDRIRTFLENELVPTLKTLEAARNASAWRPALQELRQREREC